MMENVNYKNFSVRQKIFWTDRINQPYCPNDIQHIFSDNLAHTVKIQFEYSRSLQMVDMYSINLYKKLHSKQVLKCRATGNFVLVVLEPSKPDFPYELS